MFFFYIILMLIIKHILVEFDFPPTNHKELQILHLLRWSSEMGKTKVSVPFLFEQGYTYTR